MQLISGTRIGFQACEIAPVLHEQQCPQIANHGCAAEKPALGPRRKLGYHRLHSAGNRQPFVDTVELVNPHADEKYRNWTGMVSHEAAGQNGLSHGWVLS